MTQIKNLLLACLLAATAGLGLSLYVTHQRLQQAEQLETNLRAANSALKTRVVALQKTAVRAEAAAKTAQEARDKAEAAATARKEAQNEAIQDHKGWADSPVPDSVADWVLDGAR